MPEPARLAVFASGGGTNFQALLDHFNAKGSEVARVELLIASRAGIGAIRRAEQAGVAVEVIDPTSLDTAEVTRRTMEALGRHSVGLIALAGYLKLIPAEVVEAYSYRIVNIHPALLPSFGGAGMYGGRVHKAVLESGATVTGPTVHLVNTRYDEGRIVAQWPVPVLDGDTAETLAARVLKVEHQLYPIAIEKLLVSSRDPLGTAIAAPDLAFSLGATQPSADSMKQIFRNTL